MKTKEEGQTLGTIRSYVIRTSRMSGAQRRGWEQHGDTYILPYTDDTNFDAAAFFPNGPAAPLILDIGFGMGRELAELAARWPDRNFLGVEVHKPGIGRLLLDLNRQQITNVRIIPHDAVEVCRNMIRPDSLDGIHLFFPDPWPKAKHHKRRLVRSGFPEMVAPLLKGGGYLYMVTDWEDYAMQMLEVMATSQAFQNDYDGFAPADAVKWRPQTAFERKGLAKGHHIFELMYRRYS